MDNIAPFPQANDFDKIVLILNNKNESDLNDINVLCKLLGDITYRQVSYYISAAVFLGLIENVNGGKAYTSKALKMRTMNKYMQIAELIAIVLENPIFNRLYVYTILFGTQELEDVERIIKDYYPDYSEAIYYRRAQTAMKWIDWIIKNIKEYE